MNDDVKDESDYRHGLTITALAALVRGGHIDEPPIEVQAAAVNYVIREDMARTLVEELESGGGSLVFEDDTLYYRFDKPSGNGERMAVLRLVDGEVEYL